MSKTLYILDGHSQIYRAYYAPFRDLTSPAGEPTRATYVFCSMLLKLLAEKRCDYLAMAVDGPVEKLHRRELFEEYKVTRKPTPEDFPPQRDRIVQIVRAMGIPVIEQERYEADDVLATLAEGFASEQLEVVLVSRDKDLDQLVGDHVVLYDPMKDEVFDAEAIRAKRGYGPAQAVEVQTLMGDSTDNIPGVPGVGPKKAAALIEQYGSVEEVVAHADELTPKLRENILASRDIVEISRKLVTLDRNVPIAIDLQQMAFGTDDLAAAGPIFAELGFNRLYDQLRDLGVQPAASDADAPERAKGENERPGTVAQSAAPTVAGQCDYRVVDTPEGLASLREELSGVSRLAVDTETTSTDPMRASLVGVSLAWTPRRGVYVPVAGPLGATVLDVGEVREMIGPMLADADVAKVGHHLKYDLIVLANAGFEVAGELFDTLIAAHVLDSTRMTYKLDALAAELLDHRCIPIEEVIGRGRNQITMDRVPIDVVGPYAAEDADVTLRLAGVLEDRLRDEGLEELCYRLELPLLTVLQKMEMRGVTVDPAVLKEMEVALSRRAETLRERIVEVAETAFNPDSPKQLGEVLFERLKLPVIKRRKTGPSTDSSVLAELASQHELPSLILDYRKLTKLLGTYLRGLGECIHPRTGRVHTSFHQAGTSTGRLSSSDPNLQNIPIRTEEGRDIRRAFVAEPGWLLLSADYSQVELRMLAHLCEDPTLTAAFAEGQDIHRTVAAEVFSVPLDEVTGEMRSRAKGVNFGIIYGQTAFGLSKALRIGRAEAGEFIERYRKRFPRIDEFLQTCVDHAKRHGYVETLFGRRRRINDIDSRNPQRRAQAERLAINSVVQGSAADLIKQAMIHIDARIEAEARPSRMLLQIHDELLFELPQDAVASEREMIISEMSSAIELSVPLKVDVGIGPDWREAK